MELSEDLFEQLEAYLDGTLPAAEREAFEARLTTDEALRQELATQRAMRRALSVRGFQHQLQQARRRQEGTGSGIQTQRAGRVIRPRWGLPAWQTYAVAASVAVVLLAGVWVWTGGFRSPAERAFDEFYQPEAQSRGGCPQELPAFARYVERNYEAALLQASAQTDDSTRCLTYFQGLTYLALKRPSEAIARLTEATRSPERLIRIRAEWYLVMAYLQAGQPDTAKQVLLRIATTPDLENPYRAPARRMMDEYLPE